MDAHLFRRFTTALAPLLTGARLEKIQEPAPDFLVLTFFSQGSKWRLCLRFGRKEPFCFMTRQAVACGSQPSAPVMRLRKYTAGRRATAVLVQFCARRLWLLMATPKAAQAEENSETLTWLLLDLRQGAEVRFLPPHEGPEEEKPFWPTPQEQPQALEDWRNWPVLTPALRRSLVHLEEAERWALLEDLRVGGGDVFLYSQSQGSAEAVSLASAWPLPMPLRGARTEISGPEALPLLEQAGQDLVLTRIAQETARTQALPQSRRLRQLLRLQEKFESEKKRLTAMTAAREQGLALREHIWRWPAEYRTASLQLPEAPPLAAQPDTTLPEAAPASESDGCNALQAQQESGPELRLDPRRTVRENMEAFFHTARRGQRGLEHLQLRRAALAEELAALGQNFGPQTGATSDEGALLAAGAGTGPGTSTALSTAFLGRLPKNVQGFISEDGFVLLRGRDAKGNLAARKLAAPHDLWLHAENGPGAHVIIRRAHGAQAVPERTLDQAGGLAACKSWQRDADRARVLYAEVRHVKPLRNAPAGTVRLDKIFCSRDVPVDHSLEARLSGKLAAGTEPGS